MFRPVPSKTSRYIHALIVSNILMEQARPGPGRHEGLSLQPDVRVRSKRTR
ncbi:hypothetical protein [Phaffia rhodozyma]|uniref:Uncharacterized protein n=1 Tax=Phaffia rhodozyma TaxID=264483 RepID=A0A0F7SPH3_PHARH|nr:hypothetical protein [Phaffia rhodozyma]